MRTKLASVLLSLIAIVTLLPETSPISGKCSDYTVGEIQALADGIVAYELGNAGAGDIQDWIYGPLTSNAGESSEWFVLTLSQSGSYDFSTYEAALVEYLSRENIQSASSREKYALALIASGSTNRYITQAIENSTGQQGIMSYIYGEHILNNGYTSASFTQESVAESIISMQLSDGGWAIMGNYSDVDVTAMAVQALAPQYGSSGTVTASIDRAMEFLSAKQLSSGGYKSMGTENPESASQVLVALSSLGIDCMSDERFIKDGNTVVDAILQYRLEDGSFCHLLDGGSNPTATIQAYYSLVSYLRMSRGQGPLYILDNRRPQDVNVPSGGGNSSSSGDPHRSGSANSGDSNNSTSPVQNVEKVGEGSNETPQENISGEGNSHQQQEASGQKTSTVPPKGSSAVGTEKNGGTETTVSSAENTTSRSAAKTTSTAVTSKKSAKTTETVSEQSGSGTETPKKESKKGGGYKVGAVIVVWTSAGVAALILLILKKRNWKNFAAVAVVGAAATALIIMTDIRSADDYYSGESVVKENAVGTVTMEIRCDTIAGENENAPADGIILGTTEFQIEEGETVWDILTQAAQTYGIQIDNTGNSMVYVAGINYLYEFDFGDLSGWIYHVNGVAPSVGCGEYVLHDGDKVEWLYTRELGNDLLQEEE